MVERFVQMANFLRSVALGVLPSVLRLIASAIEGYIEGSYGSEERGESK